jgi:hypothetical protein
MREEGSETKKGRDELLCGLFHESRLGYIGLNGNSKEGSIILRCDSSVGKVSVFLYDTEHG